MEQPGKEDKAIMKPLSRWPFIGILTLSVLLTFGICSALAPVWAAEKDDEALGAGGEAWEWALRGEQHYKAGRYNEAIEAFKEAVRLRPNFAKAYNNLGSAYNSIGKYDEAIAALKQAIRLNPNIGLAYNNLGFAYMKKGKRDESVRLFKKAILLNPNLPDSYQNLGGAYIAIGKYDQAIAVLSKALRLNPDLTLAHQFIGFAYVRKGDLERAFIEYRWLKKRAPTLAKELSKAISSSKAAPSATKAPQDARLKNPLRKAEAEKKQLETEKERAEREKEELSQQLAELKKKVEQIQAQGPQASSLPKSIAERWAVVVGISRYKDNQIPRLSYADEDAKAFAEFIKTPRGGSFKHVRVLLNDQATLINMKEALGSFLKQAQKDDLVVIYFAGHGMPEPGRTDTSYFLPHDAILKSLYATALPMQEVDQILNKRIYAEKVVMIADACHSGFVGTRTRASATEAAAVTNRFFAELVRAKPGRAVFTASSASELSQEDERWGGGHGVFTYYLLEGLKGEADSDGNGVVTVREAFDFTYLQVARATKNDQHPELKGTFDNNIPLSVLRK
jgi:tetratricopeptide (TPR) repeat protein